MGNKIVQIDENDTILIVAGTRYDFTPGLLAFITQKHPQVSMWSSHDYRIKLLLHRPRLNLTQIQEVPLVRMLHGNISICLRE